MTHRHRLWHITHRPTLITHRWAALHHIVAVLMWIPMSMVPGSTASLEYGLWRQTKRVIFKVLCVERRRLGLEDD